MRILFLAQVLPYPLDAGPKVRAYYVLRHLAERHRVTLVAFVRPGDSPPARRHLEAICERVITCPMPRSRLRDAWAAVRAFASRRPFLIVRDHVGAMHARVRALLAEQSFDAVHADQLWMAPYALAARAHAVRSGRSLLTVLDQHNAVYLVPQRLASSAARYLRPLVRWEAARLQEYERAACLAFDRVVVLTEADQAALLSLYPSGRRPDLSVVIPICVDAEALPAASDGSSGAPRALFVGGMHWPPNAAGVLWFAHEVWPRVRQPVPAAEFWVVGRKPPAALNSLASGAGIHTPGFVDDPDPYWERARVFVVPLLAGGGMRVKILDAWARGRPVVSTTIGAEGLRCRSGDDLLLADDPADFAAAVVRVLTDPALARRLVAGGRKTLLTYYHWRTTYPAWDAIYPPSA